MDLRVDTEASAASRKLVHSLNDSGSLKKRRQLTMSMAREQIKELAHKAAEEGVTLTKEQCMEMSMQDLAQYDFLVEKYKAKLEAGSSAACSSTRSLEELCLEGQPAEIEAGGMLYTVTTHALKRFIERGPEKCKKPLKLIARDLDGAAEAKQDRKHTVYSLLSHSIEPAVYKIGKLTGMLYVIVKGNVVKTCHRNESKRWEKVKK